MGSPAAVCPATSSRRCLPQASVRPGQDRRGHRTPSPHRADYVLGGARDDKSVAGDAVAPGEVLAAPSAPTVDIAVCLLDVTETAKRERVRRRGDPEELLPHHVAFASWLRRHAEDPGYMPDVLTTGGWADMQWSRLTDLPRSCWRMTVLDGSQMTRAETGRVVLRWIRDAIAGRAPVFRRAPR